MRLFFSKYAIWIYSLIIFLTIGVVLNIATIGAEEYALFDNSYKAFYDAKILRSIHSLYYPAAIVVIVSHLLVLIIFDLKKSKRAM